MNFNQNALFTVRHHTVEDDADSWGGPEPDLATMLYWLLVSVGEKVLPRQYSHNSGTPP
jgi:hypothetical protein